MVDTWSNIGLFLYSSSLLQTMPAFQDYHCGVILSLLRVKGLVDLINRLFTEMMLVLEIVFAALSKRFGSECELLSSAKVKVLTFSLTTYALLKEVLPQN